MSVNNSILDNPVMGISEDDILSAARIIGYLQTRGFKTVSDSKYVCELERNNIFVTIKIKPNQNTTSVVRNQSA